VCEEWGGLERGCEWWGIGRDGDELVVSGSNVCSMELYGGYITKNHIL